MTAMEKNTIELNKDDISIFEKKKNKIEDKSNIDEKIKKHYRTK